MMRPHSVSEVESVVSVVLNTGRTAPDSLPCTSCNADLTLRISLSQGPSYSDIHLDHHHSAIYSKLEADVGYLHRGNLTTASSRSRCSVPISPSNDPATKVYQLRNSSAREDWVFSVMGHHFGRSLGLDVEMPTCHTVDCFRIPNSTPSSRRRTPTITPRVPRLHQLRVFECLLTNELRSHVQR